MFLNDLFIKVYNLTIFLYVTVDSYESVRETADRQSVLLITIAFQIVTARYERVLSDHVNMLLNDGHSDDGL